MVWLKQTNSNSSFLTPVIVNAQCVMHMCICLFYKMWDLRNIFFKLGLINLENVKLFFSLVFNRDGYIFFGWWGPNLFLKCKFIFVSFSSILIQFEIILFLNFFEFNFPIPSIQSWSKLRRWVGWVVGCLAGWLWSILAECGNYYYYFE